MKETTNCKKTATEENWRILNQFNIYGSRFGRVFFAAILRVCIGL
jgi:hypothetical protein